MRMGMSQWLVSSVGSLAVLAACSCGDSGTGGGGTGGTGANAGEGGVGNNNGGDGGVGNNGGDGGVGNNGGDGGIGGGGAPPLNEDCSTATPVSLAPGDVAKFSGTIDEMTGNELNSSCVDGEFNNPDTWGDLTYQLTLTGACSLNVRTLGASDTEVSLRSMCSEDPLTDADFCANATSAGERLLLHMEAGSYTLTVQGEPGDFDLEIDCGVPTCGDFVSNPGEECEDGNTQPGDGCNASCVIEDADPSLEDCSAAEAGAAKLIGPGTTFIPAAAPLPTTLGALNNANGSCQLDPSIFGPDYTYAADHVYRVRSTVTGTMTITVGLGLDGVPSCGPDVDVEPALPYPAGCWDRSLYVRQGTCGAGTELDCSEDDSFWKPEVVTFAVVPNTGYFVFVDGWLAAVDGTDLVERGSYTLKVDLTAAN